MQKVTSINIMQRGEPENDKSHTQIGRKLTLVIYKNQDMAYIYFNPKRFKTTPLPAVPDK